MTTRAFGGVMATVFVLLGIVGFIVTGFAGFAAMHGDKVLLFEVNPLQNLVHLLAGIAMAAGAAGGESAARPIVAFVSLVFAIIGLGGFLVIDTNLNYLALNISDNMLHLATAALGFVAVATSRRMGATY